MGLFRRFFFSLNPENSSKICGEVHIGWGLYKEYFCFVSAGPIYHPHSLLSLESMWFLMEQTQPQLQGWDQDTSLDAHI